MRIAWISYLDAHAFSGGGELNQRTLIDLGRRRGHSIQEAAFLRRRPQRALRRTGLYRGLAVDWDADLFILENLRNAPHLPQRVPEAVIERALASGRAAVFQEAWVDVCPFDLTCSGDTSACPPDCDRAFADRLYGRAAIACFNSPRQAELIASVIDVPLPRHTILSRPMIDTERFRPMGLERDLDVLYVGVVSRAKGYYNVLERYGEDRLTVAGLNMLGEPVRGNYLGTVAHEELPRLYNRARIFAHLPEWEEPMGRTVVEAKLCGCEVVTNDRVGVLSYPPEEWSDPEVVRGNGDRFWAELEAAAAAL